MRAETPKGRGDQLTVTMAAHEVSAVMRALQWFGYETETDPEELRECRKVCREMRGQFYEDAE